MDQNDGEQNFQSREPSVEFHQEKVPLQYNETRSPSVDDNNLNMQIANFPSSRQAAKAGAEFDPEEAGYYLKSALPKWGKRPLIHLISFAYEGLKQTELGNEDLWPFGIGSCAWMY